jgi:hypothetical protein
MSRLYFYPKKVSFESMPKNEEPLSDESIASLTKLGEILMRIHNRLISEGWIIKDEVFTPPPGCQPPKEPQLWKRKSDAR